ncbi:MAG TPA: enoyl-CoA hydratase-related protein [Thermoleophilaceae bacterium]|jgi:crotonobetainyl-CoA hydratase|nr:enoyl-CoA hydratase-related protein [Thermoleophilaceae bacterium]
MSGAVQVETRGQVLEILLDRPNANAIDRSTSLELHDAFARLRDDPDLRVGILTGAGERFFSAGWDLKAAAAGEEDPGTDFGPGGFAGLTEMFDLDKPVIAAVNGLAAGGGFELVLACDLIVAAEHAELFLPELSLGVVPDAGGAQRLPRRLPWFVAMDLLLTGRRLGANEAERRGLVRSVVPAAELVGEARRLAEHIAGCSPLVVQATKEIARRGESLSVGATFAAMAAGRFPAYARAIAASDFLEGARAFADGREGEPPVSPR